MRSFLSFVDVVVGVMPWSFSLTADDAMITRFTFDNSQARPLWDGGFKKTERTERFGGSGRWDVISAIVLSFTEPISLPPTGTEAILGIHVQAWGPVNEGEPEQSWFLSFYDGLRGSGQSVLNAVIIEGAAERACNLDCPPGRVRAAKSLFQ